MDAQSDAAVLWAAFAAWRGCTTEDHATVALVGQALHEVLREAQARGTLLRGVGALVAAP
jgi:hypothetical protein